MAQCDNPPVLHITATGLQGAIGTAPVILDFLLPSVFCSALFSLNLEKASTWSVTPLFPTLSMNSVVSSHLEPKEEALRVSVSLVCDHHALVSTLDSHNGN